MSRVKYCKVLGVLLIHQLRLSDRADGRGAKHLSGEETCAVSLYIQTHDTGSVCSAEASKSMRKGSKLRPFLAEARKESVPHACADNPAGWAMERFLSWLRKILLAVYAHRVRTHRVVWKSLLKHHVGACLSQTKRRVEDNARHDRPTPPPARRVHGANRPGQHAYSSVATPANRRAQSHGLYFVFCFLPFEVPDVGVRSEVASAARVVWKKNAHNRVVNFNESAACLLRPPSILSRCGRNAAAAGMSPILVSPTQAHKQGGGQPRFNRNGVGSWVSKNYWVVISHLRYFLHVLLRVVHDENRRV